MKAALSIALSAAAALCTAGEWTLTRTSAPGEAGRGGSPVVPVVSRGETDTNHVDVMIVYDAAALRWLDENKRNAKGFADDCMADLNKSLGHTGISRHFTFRLADTLDMSSCDFSRHELDEIVAGFAPLLVGNAIDDAAADAIRTARDDCGADLVAIFTVGKNRMVYGESTGLREFRSEPGPQDMSESAYCVISIEAVEKNHALLHELGHLLGAGHCDTQIKAPGPQLFPFSSAYRTCVGTNHLTTVVGYPKVKDGVVLPFFSSPDYELAYTDDDGKTYGGICVGTESNDNTRTVIAAYPVVAQYRASSPSEELKSLEDRLDFALGGGNRGIGAAGGLVSLRCGVVESIAVKYSPDATCMAVESLPPGLAFNRETKSIEGKATSPGKYVTHFTFGREGMDIRCRRHATFEIKPLPNWATGTFATKDGRRRIKITDSGTVIVTSQRAFKIEKRTLPGFAAEETDPSGDPIFILEDGKRLSLAKGDDGEVCGVIADQDGTRFAPAAKRRSPAPRKKKSAKNNKGNNRKEKQQ